jgi:hypothetical protein
VLDMTKTQKLCLIDTFRETLFDKNYDALDDFLSNNQTTDTFEIDRFLLKDICHLLNQYKKEIITNANQ